ncbi:MAG: FtsW/RodA/SpoVE family cell cycle protein [Candidatus Limnocylindrales bacterium]
MSTIRLEPARVGTLTAREGEGRWYGFDLQLAIYALSLTVVGLLMAFTNSAGDAFASSSIFMRSLVWLALAAIIFVATAAADHHWLRTFAWPIYGISIALLVLTLAVGSGIGGVQRWVSIFGFQFQFSEVVKVLLAVVLAHYLAKRSHDISSFRTFLGAGLVVTPLLALVLIQPDLGTSLVLGAILLGALFFAGASLRWLIVLVLGVMAMIPVAWQFVLRDYQKQRLISFLDPSADPLGAGYQLQQSQITVGSGGLLGRGLTNSLAGQNLPVGSTDFVFAHVSEQLGFLGGTVVLALFALLIWRVLHVGWRSGDTFTLAFAGGIAGMLLFQMIVNVGMVLGVMPITGLPLPFVTYGGASLLSAALGLGILESLAMSRSRSD